MNKQTIATGCLTAMILAMVEPAQAARTPKKAHENESEESRIEYRANDMLNRGIELLKAKQEERGLKIITSIPTMYPKAKTRFNAYLALGEYFLDNRQFDRAVKQFQMVDQSENDEQKAEALFQMGICYYNLSSFDKAFVVLRKVINEYPWSVFANEAYYYIGLCHFKQHRWSRAVEALEKVGTSVNPSAEEMTLAEAGQRLFLKVHDEDLIVLMEDNEVFNCEMRAASGDSEALQMTPLGKSGSYFIGSIPTKPGEAVKGDGVLQCIGGDTVSLIYTDKNTTDGKSEQTLAKVQMVSTASIGFTDGAYREYTRGVFGDQSFFVRVKDLDMDLSAQRNSIEVRVFTQYKVEKEVDVEKRGVTLNEEDEIVKRDAIEMTLIETEPHSGMFVGSKPINIAFKEEDIPNDDDLWAMKNDDIILEYVDTSHIGGEEPRTVQYDGKVLVGALQDVKVEHREVETLELEARKNLIEAKIFLKLGTIFKEVGLLKQAYARAEEGLERTDEVISTSLNASLDRNVVEEAFNIKWELLLVQDRLNEAIGVCNTLIRMFPDSALVDRALMKLAIARMESGDRKEIGEAMRILSSITRLPKSDLKAEAQYMIAEAQLKMAVEAAKSNPRAEAPDLSRAMLDYKACADNYPESQYAGKSLDKIANYYIKAKDYNRAMELMEQIFQDYPDASFLDEMLMKWVIAAYRAGEFQMAYDKCNRLLMEYPDSKAADKATKFKKTIARKLGI